MQVYTTHLQELGIDLDQVLEMLPVMAQPYTVFLSGSIIEGYGNAASDLDVFIVYPEEVPAVRADFNMGTNFISIEYLAEKRIDVESWSREQMLAAAQRLRQCSPDDWNGCNNVNIHDINLAHSIRIGVPIHPEHEENFQQIRQAFDFEHLSRIITTRCLVLYNGSADDAGGAIISKQHGAAMWTARRAVHYALDALLASHGDTNPKEKWRFFKLEKLGDSALLERYWELELMGINGRDAILEYAKECLIFAQQIVLKVYKKQSLPT